MTFAYSAIIYLKICFIIIKAKKSDLFSKKYDLINANIKILEKYNRGWYFSKILLLVDVNVKIVFKILLLDFINLNVNS